MTKYILHGSLDELRQYAQSAVGTKNALRLVNPMGLPIADMYRTKPDGTVIHAMQRHGQESVTVELPPPVPLPEPEKKKNVITPPIFWISESFYIVFNIVEPERNSQPVYTGEHLAGYYVPADIEYTMETRTQGTPGYVATDGIIATALDANAALTPTLERDFRREVEPITNYDAFTLEGTTERHYSLYGVYDDYGGFHELYGRRSKYINKWGLFINGAEFHRYENEISNASGMQLGADSVAFIVGRPGAPYARGTYAEWEQGAQRPPTDDRDGEPSVGDYLPEGNFAGGAYDYETDAFICIHQERNVSLDWNPDTYYLSVGKAATADIQIMIAQEYEEYYGVYLYVKDCRIYNTPTGQIFLVSYMIEDEFDDYNHHIYYKAFKRDSDGNYQVFEKEFLNLGDSIDDFYFHYMTDQRGQEWPVNGTMRVVRETTRGQADGTQMSWNPNDELQYDATRLEVREGQGY